jgi:hypothetical protein
MSAQHGYPQLAGLVSFGVGPLHEEAKSALKEIDRLRADNEAWMNGVADAVEPLGYNREAACGPSDLLPGLQDLRLSPSYLEDDPPQAGVCIEPECEVCKADVEPVSASADYPWLPTTAEGIDQYYAMSDEIDRLRACVRMMIELHGTPTADEAAALGGARCGG